MIYAFIAERCSDLPVSTCCRVMKVSTSGFYQRRPDGSEELVVTERTLLQRLSGEEPADVFLNDNMLEISSQETSAVFERIS